MCRRNGIHSQLWCRQAKRGAYKNSWLLMQSRMLRHIQSTRSPAILTDSSEALAAHPLQEMAYIQQETPVRYRINEGMVSGMRVPGKFYVNERLKGLIFDELAAASQRGGQGGFLPAIKQIANVAALPGIVKVS